MVLVFARQGVVAEYELVVQGGIIAVRFVAELCCTDLRSGRVIR